MHCGCYRSHRADLQLLVAGSGDEQELLEQAGDFADKVRPLGLISTPDKASLLHSVDLYCAPNIGGESFGMILTEAMSAGCPVVASDLDAFSRVLDGGAAGVLSPVADAPALAAAIGGLLDDPVRRASLVAAARTAVAGYDWPVVAAKIVKVYETVIAADPRSVVVAD